MKDKEQTLDTHFFSLQCELAVHPRFLPPLSFSSSSSVSPCFVAQSFSSTAVSHVRIQRLLRPPALLPRPSRGAVGGTTLAALAAHVTATTTQSPSPAQQDHSVHSLLLPGPLATLPFVAPSVAEKPVRRRSAKRTRRCHHWALHRHILHFGVALRVSSTPRPHAFSLDPVLPFLPAS